MKNAADEMTRQHKVWAIIPAGGVGLRMQADQPKQYLFVCGQPIIHHTLSRICASPSIDGVIVGIADTDHWWPHHSFSHSRMLGVYAAGVERADTVRNGLDYLLEHQGADESDWALVHDAVRPCILQQDIESLVNAAIHNGNGAVLGGGLADTLKIVDENDRITDTVPRDRFCRTYTPQIFRIRDLIHGIDQSRSQGVKVTDESMAMEAVGIRPILVRGHPANIKVTVRSDLDLMEVILEAFE